MGLDMYLNKKTYVKKWAHTPEENVYKVSVDREKGHVIKSERVTFIEEELMYWRKANHIHKFFVDRCGGGDDNCREMYVSDEIILELIEDLKKVVESNIAVSFDVAEETLPTTDGFFFGSTHYDNYYFEECERTLKELQQLVDGDLFEGGDLYYQASW